MSLSNYGYPKRYAYYDDNRRDRISAYSVYGTEDGEARNGINFSNAYIQTFTVNATNAQAETVVRSLANGVKECIRINGIIAEDDDTFTLDIGHYFKDKDGEQIPNISEPFIQINYQHNTLVINKSVNPDKTAVKLFISPPRPAYVADYITDPLINGERASSLNTMSDIYVLKYSEGGLYPQLNQYYSNNFFSQYYDAFTNGRVTTDEEYDALMKQLVNGGDGTPITPILPSEDTSNPGGGDEANPDYNPFSDPIDYPDLPTGGGALDTGFISVYAPTTAQLRAFANELWSNDFITTIRKTNNDPMEGVISLHSVPFQIVVGSTVNAKVGNYQTSVSMLKVNAQYYTLNCGNVSLPEHWASALDYEPYTDIELYLPFVGVRPVQVDDIMNRVIEVKYNIDVLTGASICLVKCGDSVLYTYPCTIAQQIPYTMSNRIELYRAIINGASAIASSASGGPAGASRDISAAGASRVISSAASVALSKHSSVTRGGNLGGNIGVLGDFTPYLIIHRPIQSLAGDFAHKKGYPANITATLGSVSGYTVVNKIHLNGIDCTDTERDEIDALLKDGVII